MVRRALKYNSSAFIVVIGCYAQLKPKEISSIKGVDLVLGAQEKFNLKSFLHDIEKRKETQIENKHIKHVNEFYPGYSKGDRVRSFFKVQDGCNYFCSFCTIPLARGKSRSANVEETMVKAREIASSEVKEVVLTGVNIGDFGYGTKERLIDLLIELDKLEQINRFRISSIEPDLLSNEIIEFVHKSKRFVPHFHIPLQSGSDILLKSMRRRYNTELYKSRIEKIKDLMPKACIGVDVIVGYPGETEEEFNKTVHFLKSLPISYLHVFTYSERANTTAPRMGEIVPMEERRKRSKQLRILSLKLKQQFYQNNLGKTEKVLLENQEDGYHYGFTENYVKVKLPAQKVKKNEIVSVKLNEINNDFEVLSILV